MSPSARRRIHYSSDALLSIRNHPAYVATLGSRQSLYYPAGTDSLASYLSKHTTSKEDVFIFGEEPGAYWKADRMPATRFVYSLLFTSGVIPNADLLAMNDSIMRKKPAIIVIERFDTTAFRGKPETSESLMAKRCSLQRNPQFAFCGLHSVRHGLWKIYCLLSRELNNLIRAFW